MTDKSLPEPLESFPIPEGAIQLDSDSEFLSPRALAIAAIKKILLERNLQISLGPETSLEDEGRLLIFNGFSVQLEITGILSNEISIDSTSWGKASRAPQLIIAVQVDEENCVVNFLGLLTGAEFTSVSNGISPINGKILLDTEVFKGGIDRLFTLVQLVEQEALPPLVLKNNNLFAQLQGIRNPLRRIQIPLLAGVASGGVFFKYIFVGSIATGAFAPTLIPISGTQRSGALASSDQLNVCLLSPMSDSDSIVRVSFDRPLIFSKKPLNQIQISKNGKVIWNKTATIKDRIEGPIEWPVESIKSGESFVLLFRNKGSSPSEIAKVVIKTDQDQPLKSLNSLIQDLGNSERRWVKMINKQRSKDKNLAFALMMSEQAPQSKKIQKPRDEYIEESKCQ